MDDERVLRFCFLVVVLTSSLYLFFLHLDISLFSSLSVSLSLYQQEESSQIANGKTRNSLISSPFVAPSLHAKSLTNQDVHLK